MDAMAADASSLAAAGDLSGRHLAELTWPEVKSAVESNLGVILPVGATEQHGPHLPLGTDYLCATAVGRAVAQETRMLVAPPLTYGCPSRPLSGGGQGFVGTTSLRPQTFMGIVRDVLTELLRHGFRRFAIVNWHYENGNFLYEAAYEAITGSDARLLVFETCLRELSQETIDVVFDGGYLGRAIEHAATYETSVMMHIHPELVHFDRLADDAAERRPWYDIIPAPPEIVPRSGVLWKVEGATPEKGARLWGEVIPPVKDAILTELG
jgi:creatinine amidohydrolase